MPSPPSQPILSTLLARRINAVPAQQKTPEDRLQAHVKITWLRYVLSTPKNPQPQRHIHDLPMMMIIDMLGEREIDSIAHQLQDEVRDRGWVDNCDGKYLAVLLESSFSPSYTINANYFAKLPKDIQQRVWKNKKFAAKVLHVGQKKFKALEESSSFEEFKEKQSKALAVKYGNQPGLIYVPVFDVFLPVSSPLLKDVQHYKSILKRARREDREALCIRRKVLMAVNLAHYDEM